MRPLDVGGAGDCFFRAVSHQLYGDPSHHLDIRTAGIAYMRENPERFIESNTEYSWLQYLNNMSMQGTWCDGMIIQAVADQFNLRIIITETHEQFSQFSIICAVSLTRPPTDIYLGHIDEYHYVSTLPYPSMSEISHNELLNSSEVLKSKNVEKNIEKNINEKNKNETTTHNLTRNSYMTRNFYMKEHMKRKRSTEETLVKQKNNEEMKKYMRHKRSNNSLQFKHKTSQYMKEYMKSKRASEPDSPQAKQKKNEYMKEYRKSIRAIKPDSPQAKQKKNEYMKEYRKNKCGTKPDSPQTKQKKNKYMKEYMKSKRASELDSPQTKQKKKQYMKDYMKSKRFEFQNQSLQGLISDFHDIVSQGPHYICTCCDQLWYKHSVMPAATLKKTIPDIGKKTFK